MSVPSTKNLQRKIWRDQCRDILSKHIQERTNIVVEPSQV
ncbi:uncharacterized protein CTRU02_215070 [Colletotrichum truncatum]|uniref:Uncharacterized protein n=1 Tax=Colletotrichum truncatum TaxID=5467 RepID=A0ACC3YDD5_COLTU|nr:uncharacterized protein CTRU02_13741 [Colletotrichum truncatum]KAF6783089.1 hypothetical protein CTRU02_13741 [Colletotrichum truncatum]